MGKKVKVLIFLLVAVQFLFSNGNASPVAGKKVFLTFTVVRKINGELIEHPGKIGIEIVRGDYSKLSIYTWDPETNWEKSVAYLLSPIQRLDSNPLAPENKSSGPFKHGFEFSGAAEISGQNILLYLCLIKWHLKAISEGGEPIYEIETKVMKKEINENGSFRIPIGRSGKSDSLFTKIEVRLVDEADEKKDLTGLNGLEFTGILKIYKDKKYRTSRNLFSFPTEYFKKDSITNIVYENSWKYKDTGFRRNIEVTINFKPIALDLYLLDMLFTHIVTIQPEKSPEMRIKEQFKKLANLSIGKNNEMVLPSGIMGGPVPEGIMEKVNESFNDWIIDISLNPRIKKREKRKSEQQRKIPPDQSAFIFQIADGNEKIDVRIQAGFKIYGEIEKTKKEIKAELLALLKRKFEKQFIESKGGYIDNIEEFNEMIVGELAKSLNIQRENINFCVLSVSTE